MTIIPNLFKHFYFPKEKFALSVYFKWQNITSLFGEHRIFFFLFFFSSMTGIIQFLSAVWLAMDKTTMALLK